MLRRFSANGLRPLGAKEDKTQSELAGEAASVAQAIRGLKTCRTMQLCNVYTVYTTRLGSFKKFAQLGKLL